VSVRAGALPDLVLHHLALGPDYVREIARTVDRPESAVSQAVQSLLARGLVQLAEVAGHRRYYCLTGVCPTCGQFTELDDLATARPVCDHCGATMLEPSASGLCGFCDPDWSPAG
jgi:DNA-binding IclR family transcriptional regulator